ncbi:hypothetical protein C5688_06585 [Methylocystis sp. MitZ-2018]|nr:hypothetical protein C5688_06585 [Methylocystis sp. MitZ-2018]
MLCFLRLMDVGQSKHRPGPSIRDQPIQAACFKTATICLTERRFFLMANLPQYWENPPEN